MNNVTVLDRLLAVNLDIHIWSARKKLVPLDLNGAELPPEDLASLGSKRVCDPEDLKIFGTLKARASNLLERNGVRFLSGWAIPEAKSQEVADELINIRDEFEQTKQSFLARYEQSVQDWIDKHPTWASIIAGSTVSKEHVSSRLSFAWQMFRVIPPFAQSGGDLHDEVDKLGYTLFEEIARDAADTWKRCFDGKSEITRKALSPLKTMQQKLHGLSFLEPRVLPVTELIQAALDSIPRRGAVDGNLLIMLQGMVCLMQNPQALMEHGQKLLDGQQQADDVLRILEQSVLGQRVSEEMEDDEPSSQPLNKPIIESHGLW